MENGKINLILTRRFNNNREITIVTIQTQNLPPKVLRIQTGTHLTLIFQWRTHTQNYVSDGGSEHSCKLHGVIASLHQREWVIKNILYANNYLQQQHLGIQDYYDYYYYYYVIPVIPVIVINEINMI